MRASVTIAGQLLELSQTFPHTLRLTYGKSKNKDNVIAMMSCNFCKHVYFPSSNGQKVPDLNGDGRAAIIVRNGHEAQRLR